MFTFLLYDPGGNVADVGVWDPDVLLGRKLGSRKRPEADCPTPLADEAWLRLLVLHCGHSTEGEARCDGVEEVRLCAYHVDHGEDELAVRSTPVECLRRVL